ncbi:MAG: hypothetical protein ACOX51_03105 [Myxococcota bacterium]|jgi:hypothetical protein|nr:hypothetical protein [Myxococcota bacterium]MBP8970024.1 hypothetical protein [Myxococcota bacterium]HQC43908.1 hypothetical protein [Myxococcota bacterium]HQL56313.1 hypothetical protein [Myxococcota bacterium]
MKSLKTWIKLLGVFFVALMVSSTVVAQEGAGPENLTPEEVTVGEVKISMSSDYASLRVDGEEWENHAFSNGGKTIEIHSLDRTNPHTIRLSPSYPDLEPFEFTIEPGDWKLTKVGKLLRQWRVEQKVVFKKAAPPKPAPKAEEAEAPAN